MPVARTTTAVMGGVVVTVVVYAIGAWLLSALAEHLNRSPETLLGWAYVAVMPLAAGVGGAVSSGLFGAGPKGLKAALLASPGAYIAMLLVVGSLGISWRGYPGLVITQWLGAGLVLLGSTVGFLLVGRGQGGSRA